MKKVNKRKFGEDTRFGLIPDTVNTRADMVTKLRNQHFNDEVVSLFPTCVRVHVFIQACIHRWIHIPTLTHKSRAQVIIDFNELTFEMYIMRDGRAELFLQDMHEQV